MHVRARLAINIKKTIIRFRFGDKNNRFYSSASHFLHFFFPCNRETHRKFFPTLHAATDRFCCCSSLNRSLWSSKLRNQKKSIEIAFFCGMWRMWNSDTRNLNFYECFSFFYVSASNLSNCVMCSMRAIGAWSGRAARVSYQIKIHKWEKSLNSGYNPVSVIHASYLNAYFVLW